MVEYNDENTTLYGRYKIPRNKVGIIEIRTKIAYKKYRNNQRNIKQYQEIVKKYIEIFNLKWRICYLCGHLK